MNNPIRILLTGASGTVGREIVSQLCDLIDKPEITVFDKKSKKATSFFYKYKNKIKIVYGDISDKDHVFDVCKNKDIVIHLAAIIPPLADKMPKLAKKVNVIGTKNLIEGLKKFSPDAFLLYSSSISVYGDRVKDPWIKVSDKLIPSERDEYAITKIEAENLIKSSNLNYTIFRLTAIMGNNNHKASNIMFHMPLDTKMEIATPSDTARAFIKSIYKTEKLNKHIYNLSGGEKCRISYKEFLSRSFLIFGLGNVAFIENSFATKNFHCGYYEDGDILNDILKFRENTLDDYFKNLEKSVPLVQKIAAKLFRRIIINNMQKKSEPYIAVKRKNELDINHYF